MKKGGVLRNIERACNVFGCVTRGARGEKTAECCITDIIGTRKVYSFARYSYQSHPRVGFMSWLNKYLDFLAVLLALA